jgi:hypothetical protein
MESSGKFGPYLSKKSTVTSSSFRPELRNR